MNGEFERERFRRYSLTVTVAEASSDAFHYVDRDTF